MTRPNSNPVEADLSAYLDGELSDLERHKIEAQFHKDPKLFAELEAAREARDLLASLPRADAPIDFSTTIFHQIPKSRTGVPRASAAFWNPLRMSGMAAALVLCSFAGWYFGRQSVTNLALTDDRSLPPAVVTRHLPPPPIESDAAPAERVSRNEMDPGTDARVAGATPTKSERAKSSESLAKRPQKADLAHPDTQDSSALASAKGLDNAWGAAPVEQRESTIDILVTPQTAEQYANAIQLLQSEHADAPRRESKESDGSHYAIEQSLPVSEAIALLDRFEAVVPQQVSYRFAGAWDRKADLLAVGNDLIVAHDSAPEGDSDADDDPAALDHSPHSPMFGFLIYDRDDKPVFLPAKPAAPRPLALPESAFQDDAESELTAQTLEERIAPWLDPATREELELIGILRDMTHGADKNAEKPQEPSPSTKRTRPRVAPAPSAKDAAMNRAQPAAESAPPRDDPAAHFNESLRQHFREFDQMKNVFDVDPQAYEAQPVRVRIVVCLPEQSSASPQ